MSSEQLVERLWSWSVHTGDSLFAEAAAELETLSSQCRSLASLLMSEYVFVHEKLVDQVDKALQPFIGTQDDASTEPTATC